MKPEDSELQRIRFPHSNSCNSDWYAIVGDEGAKFVKRMFDPSKCDCHVAEIDRLNEQLRLKEERLEALSIQYTTAAIEQSLEFWRKYADATCRSLENSNSELSKAYTEEGMRGDQLDSELFKVTKERDFWREAVKKVRQSTLRDCPFCGMRRHLIDCPWLLAQTEPGEEK